MTMDVNTVYEMDALQLLRGLDAQSVDAIITDLPYGTTACSWDTVIPFAPLWEAVKHALKPRGAFVTTASQPFTSALVMSNPKWFRYEWIWDKKLGSNFANTDYQPFKTHENVLVFSKSSAIYHPQLTDGEAYTKEYNTTVRQVAPSLSMGGISVNEGTRKPISILEYSNANQSDKVHTTQKPQALYEYLIRTYTQEGELVVDPCCGSGTTAAACIATNRRYIVGDSDPHYCEVTRQRLQHPSTAELKAALAGKPTTQPMW